MSRNREAEFNRDVKQAIINRQNGLDAITGEPLERDCQIHHILPIYVASRWFPQLSNYILSSIYNAQALNRETHTKLHKDLRFKKKRFYLDMYYYLLSLDQERLL